MIMGWPSCLDTWSSTTRPTMSLALPALNGLITWIARVGHGSQTAGVAATASTALATAPHKKRSDVIQTSLEKLQGVEALIGSVAGACGGIPPSAAIRASAILSHTANARCIRALR
jgi:hypothetical protein